MDKQTISTVVNKVAEVIAFTLPGLLVLDVVFKKGLLHGAPATWIELVLLLIYAIGLSTPFYALSYLAAVPLFPYVEDENAEKEEKLESGFAAYLLLFSLATVAAVIFIFQYLSGAHYFEITGRLGLSVRAIQLAAAYLLGFLICGPFMWLIHASVARFASNRK